VAIAAARTTRSAELTESATICFPARYEEWSRMPPKTRTRTAQKTMTACFKPMRALNRAILLNPRSPLQRRASRPDTREARFRRAVPYARPIASGVLSRATGLTKTLNARRANSRWAIPETRAAHNVKRAFPYPFRLLGIVTTSSHARTRIAVRVLIIDLSIRFRCCQPVKQRAKPACVSAASARGPGPSGL
jgi:hypothetical protein